MKEEALRQRQMLGIKIRSLTVTAVTDLSPLMRRVEFEIADHAHLSELQASGVTPFTTPSFDDNVRLFFPDPNTGELPPIQHDEAGRDTLPAEAKHLSRAYTVRKWDPDTNCLIIDFARHQHGLAEAWSQQVQEGQQIWLGGPRSSRSFPYGIEELIMVADPTALPAVLRASEEAPAGCLLKAVCLAPENAFAAQQVQAPNLELQWLIKPSTTQIADVLADFFRAAPPAYYFWAAGETNQLRQIRQLARTIGIDPRRSEFTGYWRKTAGEHLQVSVAAADLLDILQQQASSESELVTTSALPPAAVRRALDQLLQAELVHQNGGHYELTSYGRQVQGTE